MTWHDYLGIGIFIGIFAVLLLGICKMGKDEPK